jgi:hypothetical protein
MCKVKLRGLIGAPHCRLTPKSPLPRLRRLERGLADGRTSRPYSCRHIHDEDGLIMNVVDS